jgi:hypothetical protein
MDTIGIENMLYLDVKAMIEQSRQRVAASFDAEITMLYWNVGYRLKTDIVNTDIVNNGRAEYGERILDTFQRI